jgi:hypothetical protein
MNDTVIGYASKASCRKLLEALELGPVKNCGGGSISDVNFKYVCSRWELLEIIQELGKMGISVVRIDSGGTPTWDLRKRTV